MVCIDHRVRVCTLTPPIEIIGGHFAWICAIGATSIVIVDSTRWAVSCCWHRTILIAYLSVEVLRLSAQGHGQLIAKAATCLYILL